MMTSNAGQSRFSLTLLRQMAGLIRLSITGPGGKIGVLLYLAVLALELSSILVTLKLIEWTKAFYDALQQLNADETIRQVGVFALIVLAAIFLQLSSSWLRKLLEIRWRGSLTSQVLDRWFKGRAYLRTRSTADGGTLDNPDQRIAEDCRILLAGPANDHGGGTGLIPLSLDLISNIVGLFSYVAVLWSLSTFALNLNFIGIDGELPRYMVWAAFLYVALCSGITHILGKPLKGLYFNQQRQEADYRFALVRVRENADAVALSGGEASERAEIDRRFQGIVTNWKRLIGRELTLLSFTYPYRFTVMRIPTFLALPAFFAGNVTFGGLMQLGNAFAQVVTTLSWFIFSYRQLAEVAAATSRLARFLDALEPETEARSIALAASKDGSLSAKDLRLALPGGRDLLRLPDLTVGKGEAVWLRGASGIGKTTLIKAFASVWPHGTGEIAFPRATHLFLTQQPYLPIGGVAEAIAYPRQPSDFSADAQAQALRAAKLDVTADTQIADLSGGERQRLALARVFLHRPEWVYLDEATSALDRESELHIMRALRQTLPNSAFIVVAHRQPEGLGALRTIDLDAYVQSRTPAAA